MTLTALISSITKAFLLTVLFNCTLIEAKQLAITFDDSPRAANGFLSGPERASRLVKALAKHKIAQVAFFSVSKHLNVEGVQRLKTYSDAGHIIANHSHDHSDFNQLPLAQYIDNFLQADGQLVQFATFRKMFRYPYLREGNSQEKRDGMRVALKNHGYQNAYITLNNYDWFIENLFQGALSKGMKVDFTLMSEFYVDMLIESIEYYDELAIKHLNRSPKHVLLLHEMDISALFIGDLVDELRRRNWTIITPEQAYTDDISQVITNRVLKYNPGRIGEIARDKGQRKKLWHHSLDEAYLTKTFNEQVLLLKP